MELIELRGRDFCCFKEFTLPLSNQGLVWVSGENRDTQAADNNGSGKSTLFKAMTWCGWGQTIDGEKGDKVIRRGQKRAHVEWDMRDENGDVWTVVRERAKGAPKLELIQPDGQPFNAPKDVIQERINEMTGLDFAAFKNTVLYGQNDTARFAHPRTKDADRKEMLHRILRTGILTHCHRQALEMRRELKQEIRELEAGQERAQALLDSKQVDVSNATGDKAAYENQRKQTVAAHREAALEAKREAQAHMEAAREAAPDSHDYSDQISEQLKKGDAAKKKLKAAQAAATKLKAIDQEICDATEVEVEAIGRLARVDAIVSGIANQLQEVSGNKCPTCTAPLTEGEGKKHVMGLKQSEKEQRAERAKIQKERNAAGKALKVLRAKANKIELVADKATDHAAAVNEASQAIADIKASIAKENARSDLEIERARASAQTAKGHISAMRKAKDEPNPYEKRYKEAKKAVAKYKKTVKELKAKVQKKSDRLAYVEFWVRGFSNQGLPSYILDGVVPYIANRANHYLETLADGDIKMFFNTQREKKSAKGEYRDEIDITWEIEGVEDSYPPSGGQLKKMEIAVDLALMDLVATREGNHIDLLVLDEVLDGLDDEGVQRVLLLLNEMRTRRGSIFVISHEADVAEIFEKAVHVVKRGGVSTVKGVE